MSQAGPDNNEDRPHDASIDAAARDSPSSREDGSRSDVPKQTGSTTTGEGLDLLGGSGSLSKRRGRPQSLLQSRVTTSISLADADTMGDSPIASHASSRLPSRRPSVADTTRHLTRSNLDFDDGRSIKSLASRAPTLPQGDIDSLMDAAFKKDLDNVDELDPAEEEALALVHAEDQTFATEFESEFVELESLRDSGSTEESLQLALSLKLKHFFILSSAGKPIWSRHGDDQLVTGIIGVVQTIISFFQDEDDILKSFVAGNARFVVLSKGHLHLAAVSRMGETDVQLNTQLDSLYMQILSTLSLPNLEKMFINRPSMDLRRPLQGTETLLSALSDGFTRGSPSTMLSSLESLRLRKAQRLAINNVLIKARDPSLLYGLLVTGNGQLISVLRPKKHSLHPSDLQLIFNMIFEAKGVRAGGGENWVPLCLPAFNNQGFVYMYVSFLDINAGKQSPGVRATTPTQQSRSASPATELAIILISASKEAFFQLRSMRDALVAQLTSSASLSVISTALLGSRPALQSILPGSPLLHFLFKSRAHVQFVLPSAHPHFASALSWRRLMSRYGQLHAAVHGRAGRAKAVWSVDRDSANGISGGLRCGAWVQQSFEVYAIAPARTSRTLVARAMSDVVTWAQREEERLFVIGGAVF